MKLVWKIVIALIVLLIIGFSSAYVWAYNKMTKVEALEIVAQHTQKEKIEKADKWLAKLQKENKFNGAILLIKNDSILLKKTYGFSDFKKKKKLNNQSSFRLASVSKQFTGTGIMLLKEPGQNHTFFDKYFS